MDSRSSDHLDSPKRLKTLASNVKFSGGNVLLHKFVLDNSHPNVSGSEIYVRAVLLSMSDFQASAVNALNDEGFTALHLAVLKNNLLLVTKLLSYLANIDVSTKCGRGHGNTALHLAVKLGRVSVIQELSMFDVPASAVNALNDEGFTALHLAVLNNNLKMVEKLLSCLTNIDVNARGGLGDENTALHLAVESGHLSIVQELFNKGASIVIMNRAGETALMVAIKLHALDIVKIFVSADVNQHTPFHIPLHLAARYGSSEIAEFLIDQGADIDARDVCGVPLHAAVFGGKLDVVKLLVGKGADLNVRWGMGATLLHVAVMMGKFDCAAFLIDQGADLHAADENGWTPLHAAALKDRVYLVRALLDRGADVTARDVRGQTPLHNPAYGGHVDVLLALLDRGAEANARDVRGRTPLDLAIERQNQSCIEALQNVG